MANKRDFKKSIDAIGGAICNEMMVAYYNIEGADKNAIALQSRRYLARLSKPKTIQTYSLTRVLRRLRITPNIQKQRIVSSRLSLPRFTWNSEKKSIKPLLLSTKRFQKM